MDKSDIDRIIAGGRETAKRLMLDEHEKIQAAMKAEIEARQADLRRKVEKWLVTHLEGGVINAIKTASKQVNVYCGEDREFALALRDYLKDAGYEATSVGKPGYGRNDPEYSVYLTLPPGA